METKEMRRPRADNNRALQERVSERAPIAYRKNSKFMIPESLYEAYPHKHFGWIRYAYGDSSEDRFNYETSLNENWDPVPSTLCPELASRVAISPFERPIAADELIRRAGHILMWCDKEVEEARVAHYNEQNMRHAQMSSMCSEANLITVHDERSYGRGAM